MESLIGTTLGGYKLTRAIGSGGMGTVYLAEDQGVGQQVAIKLVRADESDFADSLSTERTIERFKQEARAIARLDHLHILPLYRYGEEKILDSIRAYMVMQYRPEGSLWDWLRKRAGQALGEQAQISNPNLTTSLPSGLPTNWPLSVTEAADYLQQASSALQYAHDHGIVHRDVKPANFLLRFDCNHATNTTTAFLLLSDFGLAKSFSTDSSTSILLGTPMYMAPEQFYGNAGPESDQYALAVMAYYLLTGRPPFMGDPATMMHQHLTVAPPSIRSLVPELSFGVEAVLNRALAKQIQDRYPSIAAFAEDFLQRIHDGPSRPLILGRYTDGGSVAPTVAAPVGVPPLIVQPQSAGNRSPSTFPPLPPTPYMSSPGNSTPMIPPLPPTMQGWHQDATVQQIGQIPKPPPSISKDKLSRRRAVGWIVGGVAVLGLGAIVSVALSSANHQPAHTQTQNTNGPNPQQTPQAGTVRYVLKGHSGEVRSISWSPAGDQLASGSLDTSVRVWDVATQQTFKTYTGHTQGVEAVAWGQNDQSGLIASGGRDESVRFWNSTEQGKASTSRDLGNAVNALTWMTNNTSILVGTDGGLQEVFVNRKPVKFGTTRSVINAIALSSDGRYLAIASENGTVIISSLTDEEFTFPYISRGARPIFGLAWSTNNLLAIGGSDQTVAILNVASGNVVNKHTTQSTIHGLSWEPNGSGRLAIALEDATVSIWNTTDDTVISGKEHTAAVTSVAWGNQLASASADKTIIIWNV